MLMFSSAKTGSTSPLMVTCCDGLPEPKAIVKADIGVSVLCCLGVSAVS